MIYTYSAFIIFIAICWAIAPRRKYPDAIDQCGDVKGKICLVTGPTSGIGIETARVLAVKGASTVILAARSLPKLEKIKNDIQKEVTGNTELKLVELDLNDLDSVQQAIDDTKSITDRIDILICNAGIMGIPDRQLTKQGIEKQVGVCHVAHAYYVQG